MYRWIQPRSPESARERRATVDHGWFSGLAGSLDQRARTQLTI
jgi:hypothetical protein